MIKEKKCSGNKLIHFTNLKKVTCIYAAAIILVLPILVFSNQNYVQAQTTMYNCDPNIGINISMVNCLTNDTADTYYHSFAAEKRLNETFDPLPTSPQITNETMSMNEIRNQTMGMDVIPGFENDTAVDLTIE
jgi:hypothetical protein